MKHYLALVAFVALFGRLAVAVERWEVFPLVTDADITTMNTSEWGAWDPAVWHVVRLPDVPEPQSNTALFAADDDCNKDGNNTSFCVIQTDQTKCNIAVRIPSLPRPGWQEFRADSWVYTHNCDRVRGCKLLQNRDGKWWSIYSDLKYAVEARTSGNQYPAFKYADYTCTGGLWCFGWSYILDDPDEKGASVYIYRHSFPCNQQ